MSHGDVKMPMPGALKLQTRCGQQKREKETCVVSQEIGSSLVDPVCFVLTFLTRWTALCGGGCECKSSSPNKSSPMDINGGVK